MGRRKKFSERMVASFVTGTLARLDAALRPGEDRTDLVREAVDDKLAARERLHKPIHKRTDREGDDGA